MEYESAFARIRRFPTSVRSLKSRWATSRSVRSPARAIGTPSILRRDGRSRPDSAAMSIVKTGAVAVQSVAFVAVVRASPLTNSVWFATMPNSDRTRSLRRSRAAGARKRARSVRTTAPATARIAASTIGGVSASASFPKTGNVPKQNWTARRAAIARPSARGRARGSGNGRRRHGRGAIAFLCPDQKPRAGRGPLASHVSEGGRLPGAGRAYRARHGACLFVFEEDLTAGWGGFPFEKQANEGPIHVAVRLDAGHGLLTDVAPLGLGDEPPLSQPRLVGQDGLRQLEAPARNARLDAQALHVG